ncbi:MAG: phosphate transport regulator [Roseateles depolymerans]|uniref:Phosphate transport regulator n=1 Tax=Roseateles depolymerans TaxID=76731 RepID=A0A2W5FSD1_9BURK|nr:MAG: phosphate transport regulator [Roseateles depolymerans]
MDKTDAVASLGQQSLLLPAWVNAALRANDRLKLLLTLLQLAASHALAPQQKQGDLRHELATAGLDAPWLRELPASASRDGEDVLLPELPQLCALLATELATMARPLLASETDAPTRERCADWQTRLGAVQDDVLSPTRLLQFTHGHRPRHGGPPAAAEDSLHLLVMDLHKQLNQLAASLSSEEIAGAHVWQLGDATDRARVAAFMRGLQRTAGLKFSHPGLDTAATRDGERLLIQNDIGTNDAHVLVIQVQGLQISLTYSDLHRTRFAFFQQQLAEHGAQWSAAESHVDAHLNRGEAYQLGTARFDAQDEAQLQQMLEGIASRIVFLIDWNRARKRLLRFVSKEGAIAVLAEAARQDIGHMGWLVNGGEQLVFDAMQALGDDAFRIGDRLEDVLGSAGAQAYLLELMRLATAAQRQQQPAALVADEARLLLARLLQQRRPEFDLLAEHAAYCEALAASIAEALGRAPGDDHAATQRAQQAKSWERQADHLVMSARERALRQPRWRVFARLLEQSDDAADALEECAFLLSLVAEHHKGWDRELQQALQQLADTVLQATQEQVKAVAIATRLGRESDAEDHDAFIAATWQVLRAERQADELLRQAKRRMLRAPLNAAALMLANELAAQLEQASDRLLSSAYGLRELAFSKSGVSA